MHCSIAAVSASRGDRDHKKGSLELCTEAESKWQCSAKHDAATRALADD